VYISYRLYWLRKTNNTEVYDYTYLNHRLSGVYLSYRYSWSIKTNNTEVK